MAIRALIEQRATRGRRWRDDESGQAIVEFVIVVPLVIMIFLFGQWFVELVQIKLKVQESARYAAWEATAYPLHDYNQNNGGLNSNFTQMRTSVMADTTARFADLNSSTFFPRGTSYMMASWTPPVVLMTNQQEEAIYGGAIPNLIFNLVTALAGALLYNSNNPYATALIGFSRDLGSGQAMTSLFGDAGWGFNRNGYVLSTSMLMVRNEWFRVRVMGEPIFSRSGFMLRETNGVLADSWRLNHGGDFNHNGPLHKQIARMYLSKPRTRTAARTFLAAWLTTAQTLLSRTPTAVANMPTPDQIMTVPAVSMYGNSGKIAVKEDTGTVQYDTVPRLGAYKETRRQRGEHFMGCKTAESLGCTDSLSQDNPFGDYIIRE
jgi:hypothetical protein